jgi:hypothetical protein
MATLFLLGNLALAWLIAGFVWAHQIEIFRAWRFLDEKSFRAVHDAHWRTLPVWVVPIVLSAAGSVALIGYHPAGSPAWAIRAGVACQAVTQALTVLFWGRWQANLRTDADGPRSVALARLVRTHWVRAVLVTAYAGILVAWMVMVRASR